MQYCCVGSKLCSSIIVLCKIVSLCLYLFQCLGHYVYKLCCKKVEQEELLIALIFGKVTLLIVFGGHLCMGGLCPRCIKGSSNILHIEQVIRLQSKKKLILHIT